MKPATGGTPKLEVVATHRGGDIREMRCSGVVKLVMGLHQVVKGRCSENGASPPKEVHDGTSPWKFQGV